MDVVDCLLFVDFEPTSLSNEDMNEPWVTKTVLYQFPICLIKWLWSHSIYIGQFSRSKLPGKIKVFKAIHQVTNELYYIRYVIPSSTATVYIQATPILPPRHPIRSKFPFLLRLSVRCIRPCRSSHLSLPLISIRQQLLLVVQQLLPRLGGILGVR